MEVTLKKAAALADKLSKVRAPVPSSFSLNRYGTTPVTELVEQATAEFEVALTEKLQVVRAVYNLRELIGAANAASGVSMLVTQRASLSAQLEVLAGLSTTKAAPDVAALQNQRAKLADNTENMYGLDDITVVVASKEMVQATQQQLERERTALEDRLAELNFTTKIQIPEDVVAVLQAHGLV